MPTNRPTATPAGTDRRDSRHSSEAQMRLPSGFRSGLRCSSSLVGACLRYCLRKKRNRSAILTQQPPLLALPIALLDRLALVVRFLALGQRQLHLGLAGAVVIEGQRDQRQALAGNRAVQLGD